MCKPRANLASNAVLHASSLLNTHTQSPVALGSIPPALHSVPSVAQAHWKRLWVEALLSGGSIVDAVCGGSQSVVVGESIHQAG